VLVAGRVNLEETLAALAKRRPVFHSERDFQVALAWQVQIAGPDLNVYLETRPAEGVHLDLAIESADHEHYTAIELKYFTRRWIGRAGGQLFDLKGSWGSRPRWMGGRKGREAGRGVCPVAPGVKRSRHCLNQ